MILPKVMLPASKAERIASIDIVRGLALFGVLQVNLIFFSGHIYQLWAGTTYPLGWGGFWLTWIRDHLISGRAIACFSMLFGVGLCIQMERTQVRGQAFGRFACRRLGALALLGIAHATLIWNGDILLEYAVTGLFLLPLVRARVRIIVIAAGLAFLVDVFLKVILGWLHTPDWLFFAHWKKQALWLLQSANQAYGHGTWSEAARWRIWEWNHLGRAINLITIFGCLPLFLVGLALWREGILVDPAKRIPTIRRIFHSVFWVGLVFACIPDSWLGHLIHTWVYGWRLILLRILFKGSRITLALGYFMGVLLLLQRESWSNLLSYLAPLGRMALTNYLVQSIICTWVFNHHGIGLWDKIVPSSYICGGMALYGIQIAWSHWWLARFKFGPAEWLWRTMTYGQWQPFLLAQPMVVSGPLSET